MSWEQFGVLFLMVTVLVGTPGPANLSLMAYGATVGAVRTLPFLVGTIAGFQAIFVLNALGMSGLLLLAPGLAVALKIACGAYMTYLAWKIATSAPPQVSARAPMRPWADFIRGLWLHPLNPKAYAMQVAVLGQIAAGKPTLSQFVVMAVTFALWGGVLNFIWSSGGGFMGRLATAPASYRALVVSLAGLMLGSVVLSLAAIR
mgnify:CR=1 FL=1